MGEGRGGLNREGGLINFPPLKRGGGLLERGGLFERGGLVEDLRYLLNGFDFYFDLEVLNGVTLKTSTVLNRFLAW